MRAAGSEQNAADTKPNCGAVGGPVGDFVGKKHDKSTTIADAPTLGNPTLVVQACRDLSDFATTQPIG